MNTYIKNLNRIEFVVTLACSGRCKHCSEGEHTGAGNLAASGVTDILLSVDAFHQETIPLEPVRVFAKAVKEAGVPIRLQPAWLVSEEDGNPYNNRTREILAELEDLGIGTSDGNVIFPSGNALKYLGEYFDPNKEYKSPYEEDPADMRAISVSPDGSVLNGNVYEKGIKELIEEYKPMSL